MFVSYNELLHVSYYAILCRVKIYLKTKSVGPSGRLGILNILYLGVTYFVA